jgi:hypothetical protein
VGESRKNRLYRSEVHPPRPQRRRPDQPASQEDRVITWMRDATGKFTRMDGTPEEARAREVFIEVLDPGSRQWRDDYRARFPRKQAIEIVESGIRSGRVRFIGYRLVPAPARPMSEATKARLAELHARTEKEKRCGLTV